MIQRRPFWTHLRLVTGASVTRVTSRSGCCGRKAVVGWDPQYVTHSPKEHTVTFTRGTKVQTARGTTGTVTSVMRDAVTRKVTAVVIMPTGHTAPADAIVVSPRTTVAAS